MTRSNLCKKVDPGFTSIAPAFVLTAVKRSYQERVFFYHNTIISYTSVNAGLSLKGKEKVVKTYEELRQRELPSPQRRV